MEKRASVKKKGPLFENVAPFNRCRVASTVVHLLGGGLELGVDPEGESTFGNLPTIPRLVAGNGDGKSCRDSKGPLVVLKGASVDRRRWRELSPAMIDLTADQP